MRPRPQPATPDWPPMSPHPHPASSSRSSTRARRWLATLGGLVATSALVSGGCSCRTETPVERAARLAQEEAESDARRAKLAEEELRRRKVVLAKPRILPAGGRGESLYVKPGHWSAVLQGARANADDFDGLVEFQVVGADRAPLTPPGTPLRQVSRRPLVVASESRKAIDALLAHPPLNDPAPRLRSVVRDRRSGAEVQDLSLPLRPLADHQYHFVVLAKAPERYAYLESLASVTARLETRVDTAAIDGAPGRLPAEKNYRVVAVRGDVAPGEVALPDNPLAWTSIAYLLWDGADPESLRPEQREALIDWLNWGGQLVVSGPDSLDLLRGSFLEPLLPARSDGARTASIAELTVLESRWGVGVSGRPLQKTPPWPAARLRPEPGARSLPGLTDLVMERRVGRGRVAVTAIRLSEPRLAAWSNGVENLFNAVLLRRPPRRFVPRDAVAAPEGEEPPAVVWADGGAPLRLDPLINTGWRGFVRDSRDDSTTVAMRLVPADAGPPVPAAPVWPGGGRFAPPAVSEGEFLSLAPAEVPGGAGGANPFGLVPSEARRLLRESAGVTAPGAGFVAGALALYLLALGPVNWAFFAAIRRVELAWVAAPLVALAGAWVIVEQARLDIGFVRSRTEVAILELQPHTPRGLLTRFTALYTSLSTVYEVEFENPAVAAPFPRSAPGEGELLAPPSSVAFERLEKSRLRDLAVASASTEFFTSEEVLDVAGRATNAVALAGGAAGPTRVEIRADWPLRDVVVARRPDGLEGAPRLEGCWVGDLPARGSANVAFLPIDRSEGGEIPFAAERAEGTALRKPEPSVAAGPPVESLVAIALDPRHFEPGETRLVGTVAGILPGVAVEPPASQERGATLVVAKLGYAPLPLPRPDVNAPIDVAGPPSTP